MSLLKDDLNLVTNWPLVAKILSDSTDVELILPRWYFKVDTEEFLNTFRHFLHLYWVSLPLILNIQKVGPDFILLFLCFWLIWIHSWTLIVSTFHFEFWIKGFFVLSHQTMNNHLPEQKDQVNVFCKWTQFSSFKKNNHEASLDPPQQCYRFSPF